MFCQGPSSFDPDLIDLDFSAFNRISSVTFCDTLEEFIIGHHLESEMKDYFDCICSSLSLSLSIYLSIYLSLCLSLNVSLFKASSLFMFLSLPYVSLPLSLRFSQTLSLSLIMSKIQKFTFSSKMPVIATLNSN